MPEAKLFALTPEEAAQLHDLMPRAYEPHPDGRGGFRPTNPANRGDVSLPCPHCSAPLARDVHPEYLKVSVFSCTACGEVSTGRAEDKIQP